MVIQQHRSSPAFFFLVYLLVFGFFFGMASVAVAGISTDGSLGPKGPLTGPNYQIPDTLGQTRGSNLFHSFDTFNINTGESATFSGPSIIHNVISRVTGGSPSSIDGLLSCTIDGANLYFMNPSGVMFGPNASLDVKGSFHVTTADYLKFSDGQIFYANLSRSSVLSMASVESFGFLSSNPAGISMDQSVLSVPAGNTLSLVGGDINIEGNASNFYLSAPGGRINIVSVASQGEVNLSTLDISSFKKLGNITLSEALVSVEGSDYMTQPAGSVIIRGGQILLQGDINDKNLTTSILARGNPGGTIDIKGDALHLDNANFNTATEGAIDHPGTGVRIDLSGDFLMTNASEIASSSWGSGRGGDIWINAGNIMLGNDTPGTGPWVSSGFYGDIGSRAYASGRSGDIYISAAGNLVVQNGFIINTAAFNWGNAGNIKIQADTLKILDCASISSNGLGAGSGGIVDVTARDILISALNANNVLNDSALTGIAAQAGYWSSGGLVKVTADNLQILDGGQINSALYGTGTGGSIEINAKNITISGVSAAINAMLYGTYANGSGGSINITAESLQVKDGGFIGSGLVGGAPGNAGGITIKTGLLDISNRGSIWATSWGGAGSSGDLNITANSITISGVENSPNPYSSGDFTGLSTTTESGQGGNIYISTNDLYMTSQGAIAASTLGSGSGGVINIEAQNVLLADRVIIEAVTLGGGQGGNIYISTAENLQIKDGSTITSGSYGGAGNAGDITIKTGLLDISNRGSIGANSQYGTGNAGDLDITANSITISGVGNSLDPGGLDFTGLSTATGSGQGGNIHISTNDLSMTSQGYIAATTFGSGSGGGINIEAQNVLLADRSLVDASSFGIGNAGDIRIHAGTLRVEDQSQINAETFGSGRGGSIDLEVSSLELANGGLINSSSTGTGNAGNIDITAGDSILLRNSSITTEAMQADGGNIQIIASSEVSLYDSKITASVGGGPQTVGGNITIDPEYVILENSQIIANAYAGKGGNILINANVFLTDPDSIVDASSALGINGTVNIQAPITNISGLFDPLNNNFVAATELLREKCIARIQGGKYSSFVVEGRDGLPIEPGNLLPGLML